MAHTNHSTTGEWVIPKPQTAGIWQTFWYLLAFTAVEFIVALAIPDSVFSHTVKVLIYIFLTIVKAAYIVGSFMHLSHEVKFLQNTLTFPMVFIVWLLIACIWEGGSIFTIHEKVKAKEKPKTSIMVQTEKNI